MRRTRTMAERAMSKIDWPACIHPRSTTFEDALEHVATAHAGHCIEWTAATSSGYGVIGRGGKYGGMAYVHRLALAAYEGEPRDEDLCALHSCDNRRCLNPAHLRWGTKKDNLHDALSRGRFPVPAMANKGQKNGQSKLTDSDVLQIRRRLRGGEPMSSIAPDFGVTVGVVSHIKHGRSWTHVQLKEASA